MTRDDIIRMAREAGAITSGHPEKWDVWVFQDPEIERFAALLEKSVYENEDMFAEAYAGGYAAGAAVERDECARVCEQEHVACCHASAMSGAKAAERCAAAIRARGKT